MNITELTATPQLIKFTLSDEELIEKYGDEIVFWAWDRQPLDYYFKMASGGDNVDAVLEIAKGMILDQEGNPVMAGDQVLPPDVAIKAFNEVISSLGK